MTRAEQIKKNLDDFIRERNGALIAAVADDNWDPMLAYMDKYEEPLPDNEIVFRAGVYKAAYNCAGIPEDVKKLAAEKCSALDMSPEIWGKER